MYVRALAYVGDHPKMLTLEILNAQFKKFMQLSIVVKYICNESLRTPVVSSSRGRTFDCFFSTGYT